MSMETATSDQERLVAALRKAIEEDKGFYQAAIADPIFRSAREQVDALLVELLAEAKEEAEGDLTSAQEALDEMDEWHADEDESANCDKARAAIDRGRERFSSGSYDGVVDAVSHAQTAWAHAQSAIANQEAAMRGTFDDLIDRYDSLLSLWWPDKLHGARLRDRDAAVEDCKRAEAVFAGVPSYESFDDAESLFSGSLLRLSWLRRRHGLIKLHQALGLLLMSVALTVFSLALLFAVPLSDLVAILWFVGFFLSPVPLAIADSRWNLGEKEPATAPSFGYLWLILLGPVAGFVSLVWILGTYSKSRDAIAERYPNV